MLIPDDEQQHLKPWDSVSLVITDRPPYPHFTSVMSQCQMAQDILRSPLLVLLWQHNHSFYSTGTFIVLAE